MKTSFIISRKQSKSLRKTIASQMITQRSRDLTGCSSGWQMGVLSLANLRLDFIPLTTEVSMLLGTLKKEKLFSMFQRSKLLLLKWPCHHPLVKRCMKKDLDRDLYHQSIHFYAHLLCRREGSLILSGITISKFFLKILITSPSSLMMRRKICLKVVLSLIKSKKKLKISRLTMI